LVASIFLFKNRWLGSAEDVHVQHFW